MKNLKNCMLLIIAMLMMLTGCATASDESYKDYDSIIIQNAEDVTNYSGFDFGSNPFYGDRKFTVIKNSPTEFLINVNGTVMIVRIPAKKSSSEYVPTNVCDISTKHSKLVSSSKELIYEYIDASSVLNNKEELKSYIEGVSAKEATFTNEDNVGAYFSYKDSCIYFNKKSSGSICEWMIVHELVHAMSYYTHGCSIEKEEYAFNLFNEVMTDIITASLSPKISKKSQSRYSIYYGLIYPYINLVGIDSIKDYFYGYDEIYNYVGKNEFEFWVIVIENYGAKNSDVYYNNLILKWYATKTK